MNLNFVLVIIRNDHVVGRPVVIVIPDVNAVVVDPEIEVDPKIAVEHLNGIREDLAVAIEKESMIEIISRENVHCSEFR